MPLFQTTIELQKYIPVDTGLSPATFLPAAQRVEDTWIMDVLGAEQYNDLLTNYQADTLSGIYITLLDAVRKAEAPFMLYKMSSYSNVRITDAGLMSTGGPDQQRALQWQVDDLKGDALFDGYSGLDTLFNYLYANQALFPLWQASSQFAQLTKFFINRVADFQAAVDINKSNWLFQKMLPAMANVEADQVTFEIGQTFYQYLKAEIASSTPPAPGSMDFQLITMIQTAVAMLTYGRALLEPDFNNIVSIFKRPRADAEERRIRGDKPDYTALSKTYCSEGEGWLKRVRWFLNQNASSTVFADYFNSPLYRPPVNPGSGWEYGSNDAHQHWNHLAKGTFSLL